MDLNTKATLFIVGIFISCVLIGYGIAFIVTIPDRLRKRKALRDVRDILKSTSYLSVLNNCFKNIRIVKNGHFYYNFETLGSKQNVESFQITNNLYKYLQKHFDVMLSKEKAIKLHEATLQLFERCENTKHPDYTLNAVEAFVPSFTLKEAKIRTKSTQRKPLHYTIRLTPEYTKLLIKQTN